MLKYLTGKNRRLSLPNGEEHKALYVIADLDDLKASHNEITFNDTPGYPLTAQGYNINDRNYRDDLSAQRQVQKIAESIDTEKLISLSGTDHGTPIINKDGTVVSGNNRIMSLKLAVKQYPQEYEKYKQQLAEDTSSFGFDDYVGSALLMNDSIALQGSSFNDPLRIKFNHPVLVRIDESLPEKLGTEDLAKFNQDTKKAERPVDKAIKTANILLTNDACRNAVLTIIDGYDTFSDFYAPEARVSRKKLIENFVQCGLIPEAQLPAYFDNGEFTDAGKDYVEMLLSAIILTPDALKVSNAEGVKRLRQIVIGSLPLLITNANLPGASLKNNVSQALVLQYKINQAGDFSDYMRGQSLFPEEKPDTKTLYINSLLRLGRNAFKNAIRKYNDSIKSNSGTSLFGASETLNLDEIFNRTIVAAADETDKKIINMYAEKSAIGEIANTSEPIFDEKPGNDKNTPNMITEKDVIDIEAEPSTFHLKPLNLFAKGNFFKQHPDNVLGEAYETTGKFGKITRYRGKIDAISRIDVPLDFIGNMTTENNALISTGNQVNISGELMKPDTKEWVEKVVEKANRQAGEKAIRKQKTKKVDEDGLVQEAPQLQSFEDVWRTYNPEISKQELQVFIWYKTQSGKPLSRQWINLVEPGEFTEHPARPHAYNVDAETIKDWVIAGLVYYYEGKLIPAPIYLSGNMYDKKMQLERDKEEIVTLYGEPVYEAQAQAFQAAWRRVYDKRLIIDKSDDTLVILPISKIAQEFKIKRIAELPEGEPFKIKKITASSDKMFGRPNWQKDITVNWDRDRDEFDELNLVDAFSYWLFRHTPLLKQTVTYMDIVKYYVYGSPIRISPEDDSKEAEAKAKAQREKLKSSTQQEGERLFKDFLAEQLEPNDKVRIETQWNSTYNNYLEINFNKIPVAFNMCRFYKGMFEELKWEKREAVAFIMNNGSGILSYDVGVGKTPSAIFTTSAFIDAGYCKRPLIVLPNQVYKQFISEIKSFAPHIPILPLYNLSAEYLENLKGPQGTIEKIPEGVISVMTYEGFENIGFNNETQKELLATLYEILNQGGEAEREKSAKQKASFEEKLEGMMGRGLAGTMVQIEDLGFDFICYDEAHKMKKVFTAVKGEVTEDDAGKKSRGRNPYVLSSGVPSSIALKGFMINYYIQKRNMGQNVMMLTATPFTNSPLEIFSMLSMVGYNELQDTNLNNIKNFFDTYIKASTELVINSRMKPEFKQVIKGFNNLISLQSLIRRFINYKTGEDVNVNRPQKYVLPYRSKIEDGIVVDLSKEEKIETYIEMTALQQQYQAEIVAYAEGGSLKMNDFILEESDEDDDSLKDGEAAEFDIESLSDKDNEKARIIQGITWSQNLALSAYLYVHSGLKNPTYKEYVNTSPKLKYVMMCIKSVKLYHQSKGEPVSGQVIYMNRGVKYFNLLKQYLIKEVGYKEHEIGIIQSGLPKNGKLSKEYVKNLFNGEIYNESTQLFESIPDDQRIKVIIGSATIKEGINLQRYGTVLYNCFIDWNPTDIQQLEGRIYRQGNTFNAVRVVNPLMLDSADIFLFQKLEEKTKRLNTIWATDGKKNALNVEEFDPSELKYELIRDVNVIAKFKSIDAQTQLESDLIALKRQIEIIDRLKSNVAVINNYFDTIQEELEGYRNFKATKDKLADAVTLVRLTIDVDKKQTDVAGKKLIAHWKRDTSQRPYEDYSEWRKRKKEIEEGDYSDKDTFSKNYRFADFSIAVRDVSRAMNDFIRTNGISGFSLSNTAPLDRYKQSVEAKIEGADEEKKYLDSKEYKDIIIQQVLEDREKNKLEYKTIEQNVIDFSRLNYLLSDKKVKIGGNAKYTSCPPLKADGMADISPDALAYLDACIAAAGQTKDTYFVDGHYTPERQAIHEEIITDLFRGVKCVKKGAPIAVLTGGSPASGKTTYINKLASYLLTPDVFHLDADAIRAKLPGYQGWNANATHKETQDIINELLNKIGDGSCRYDVVYDGTMNKAQKYFSLINKLKGLGYKTFIIFLDIPYAVARKRALNRYVKHGRYVPMEVIDDFFKVIPDHNGLTMGQYALNELKGIVDGYIVIDGITGQIIEKGGEALPQERVYEGQADVDFKKWKAGESIIPAEIENIEPVVKIENFTNNEKPATRNISLSRKQLQKAASNKRPNEKQKNEKRETSNIPKTAEQEGQDILDTIAGLKFLADDGDQEAIDTIEGLKLLIA